MSAIIKRVPVPFAGVMLGFAALGNLLQSYSEDIRLACGILSAFCLLLLLLKIIMYPSMIAEDLKNPVMASVSSTFPMGLMLLSTYVKPIIGQAAMYFWFFSIALMVILVLYFTKTFIMNLQIPKVFASYFIVYSGIAVASVTAPAFEQQTVGNICFWLAFAGWVAMFILVTYRYMNFKEIPPMLQPLICIYTAPLSLCVAGYVQSGAPKMLPFLLVIYGISAALYVFSLVKAVGYLKLPFFPSYAAFTFPFVISAIASKMTMAFTTKAGAPIPGIDIIVLIQTVIATLFMLYAFYRFMQSILSTPKAA